MRRCDVLVPAGPRRLLLLLLLLLLLFSRIDSGGGFFFSFSFFFLLFYYRFLFDLPISCPLPPPPNLYPPPPPPPPRGHDVTSHCCIPDSKDTYRDIAIDIEIDTDAHGVTAQSLVRAFG